MERSARDADTSRLVAIAGIGRNGSTLLMRLLDGSPGLWMYPIELNYLSVLAALEERPFPVWAQLQQEELGATYLSQLVEPVETATDVVPALERTRDSSPEALLVTYLESVRRAYGADRTTEASLLAFKTIEGGDARSYQARFPGMRFIHIVREPFAAYGSLKRTDMLLKSKPFWFQDDLLRTFLERRWIPHTQFVREALSADARAHHRVLYEDLVQDPHSVLAGICEWLGIELPTEPELQTVLGGRHVRELPANTSKAGVATPIGVVRDMADRYSYEDVLTTRECQFIAFRAGELARELGYSVGGADPVSRGALARSWIWPDRWELMNVSSHLALARALLRRRAYIFRKVIGA